jgi:hypothetical protein
MADSQTSTTASTTTTRTANPVDWRAGVVAGLAGAGVMAVLISAMNAPTLAVAIPSLYGLAPPPNGVAGWAVHLSHGAVFGVGLAAVARFAPVDLGSVRRCAAVGLAYGVVLWVVAAGLLMPLWLRAVGFPSPPPVPNFAPPSLLWHAVFGVVLGAVYPVTVRRL